MGISFYQMGFPIIIGLINNVMEIPKIDGRIEANKRRAIYDLSYDGIMKEALKYNTLAEFKRRSNYIYVNARNMNILESVTAHMIKGIHTSYPQHLMYCIVKILFPDDIIRYNDRKAIKPLELDVYVKTQNIAFEYDGKYFHTDNLERDGRKDASCAIAGIKLFRITERDKRHPYDDIVAQLTEYGFNCELLNKDEIQKNASGLQMSDDDIKNAAMKYDEEIEFKRSEYRIWRILEHQNRIEEFVGHMKRYRKAPTVEEIDRFLDSATSKSDVTQNKRIYLRMMRIRDASHLAKYKKLPGKAFDIKPVCSVERNS